MMQRNISELIVSLADLLAASAQRWPERPALIELRPPQRTLTYAELHAAVEMAAQAWTPLLGRGERVIIWLDKRIETVVAAWAAMRLGAMFVIANPVLKPEQVAYLVADCSPSLIVTSVARARLLEQVLDTDRWCTARTTFCARTAPSAASVSDPLAVIARNETFADAALTAFSWEGVSPSGGSKPALAERNPPAGTPLRPLTESDPAGIFYTSGSTGFPKGVVVSHRNLVVGATSVAHYLGLLPDDRVLAALPLSFDAGFSQLSTAFAAGACAVLHDHLLARDTVQALASAQITALTAVPPLWRQLLDASWPETVGLRVAACTGGTMPPAWVKAVRERCPQVRFFVMYGLTEAFRATYLPPEAWEQRPESIGRAIPNNEVLVLRDDGSPCAPGEIGEIVQRGPLVALGYWNDPVRTAERFRPLPSAAHPLAGALGRPEIAVFSGDYGYVDEAGYLYFVGRRDAQIKTSGYRVSPEEVEAVLLRHSGVRECCVFGVPDEALGEAVAAVVVLLSPEHADEAALRAHCRAHLAPFQVPTHWRLRVETLPRNANGKIDREAVKSAFLQEQP